MLTGHCERLTGQRVDQLPPPQRQLLDRHAVQGSLRGAKLLAERVQLGGRRARSGPAG